MGNTQTQCTAPLSSAGGALLIRKETVLYRSSTHDEVMKQSAKQNMDFVDVLPTELVLETWMYLSMSDLDNAARVSKRWYNLLKTSETLWKFRCRAQWRHIENFGSCGSWQQAYRVLRKGTNISNKRGINEGLEYLELFDLVSRNPSELASFFQGSPLLCRRQIGAYVLRGNVNHEVLDELIKAQDYTKLFLPDALRVLFSKIAVGGPRTSSQAIVPVFRAFVQRYADCNPEHKGKLSSLHLLCYSLVLLSVDQFNPHVKVKMTKRDFVLNNIGQVNEYGIPYLEQLYDNVCLWGHVAEPRKERKVTEVLDMLS
eukprot:m.13991 g.13991  ORF g.13991 m.13991 type:complete len:314 (-) comp4962_c0_seq1:294-1235(-)